MNTEKKRTDKDVIITLSNFVHGSPIIQCTNDIIHEQLDIILKQQLEQLIEKHKPKTVSEASDLGGINAK